jgi:hypothetical protein
MSDKIDPAKVKSELEKCEAENKRKLTEDDAKTAKYLKLLNGLKSLPTKIPD